MKTNKSIRFDEEQLVELARIGAERGMGVAGVVRTACEVYLMKEQLAVELDDLESRMAAAINRNIKETAKVGDDVQLLIALFDQLTKFIFAATPEVIDREAAAAIANRRHAAFLADLPKVYSARRRRATLSETIEDASEGKSNGE